MRSVPTSTVSDVMDILGVKPGPVIGQALAYLLEVRMEEGPLERDEAVDRLRTWWADQPS